MSHRHRGHPLWFAYLLHRLSGLCLVLFLPLHFIVLAAILTDPVAGQLFFRWSDMPLLKLIEMVLVFLLAVHLFGGLRLIAPWSGCRGPGGRRLSRPGLLACRCWSPAHFCCAGDP